MTDHVNNLEKGVCRLSIVPVRQAGSDRSEMITQLLFGDHYSILEYSVDRKWVKIKVHFDGYEGWIDFKQHYYISTEYFDQINHSDYKITLDITSNILFKKQQLLIVMGSILPIASNELFKMEEQLAFNGKAKSLSLKRNYEFLRQVARKYINAPYLWGGKTPFGIDCSGFTQQVFKICGHNIHRDARKQVFQGHKVESLEQSKPGDLAFFQNEEQRITHVGILLEDYEIIHASGKVKVDKLDEIGIFNSEANVHTHKLSDIRRIIK